LYIALLVSCSNHNFKKYASHPITTDFRVESNINTVTGMAKNNDSISNDSKLILRDGCMVERLIDEKNSRIVFYNSKKAGIISKLWGSEV